jgi:hypothetical protein
MRKLLTLCLLLCAIPMFGQYRAFTGTVGGVDLTDQGLASYTLTAGTVKTLASTPTSGVAMHPWARTAVVCVQVQDIYWTTSGTPTATYGMPLVAGQCMAIPNRSQLEAFKFIEATSGAKVRVLYAW